MRHRDIMFTGVQFPEDDAITPREARVVIDVLAIDFYAEATDSRIHPKRQLLELHLMSGTRVYVVECGGLEGIGAIRRSAADKEATCFRYSKN